MGIDAGNGPVLPSRQTVGNGSYQPLSRPVFIYVNSESAEGPEVKNFVEFYVKNAPTLVPQVAYIPLPGLAYTTALSRFLEGNLGTVFHGVPSIGLKMEDLLRREAKL